MIWVRAHHPCQEVAGAWGATANCASPPILHPTAYVLHSTSYLHVVEVSRLIGRVTVGGQFCELPLVLSDDLVKECVISLWEVGSRKSDLGSSKEREGSSARS